jgi:hypothetical protein
MNFDAPDQPTIKTLEQPENERNQELANGMSEILFALDQYHFSVSDINDTSGRIRLLNVFCDIYNISDDQKTKLIKIIIGNKIAKPDFFSSDIESHFQSLLQLIPEKSRNKYLQSPEFHKTIIDNITENISPDRYTDIDKIIKIFSIDPDIFKKPETQKQLQEKILKKIEEDWTNIINIPQSLNISSDFFSNQKVKNIIIKKISQEVSKGKYNNLTKIPNILSLTNINQSAFQELDFLNAVRKGIIDTIKSQSHNLDSAKSSLLSLNIPNTLFTEPNIYESAKTALAKSLTNGDFRFVDSLFNTIIFSQEDLNQPKITDAFRAGIVQHLKNKNFMPNMDSLQKHLNIESTFFTDSKMQQEAIAGIENILDSNDQTYSASNIYQLVRSISDIFQLPKETLKKWNNHPQIRKIMEENFISSDFDALAKTIDLFSISMSPAIIAICMTKLESALSVIDEDPYNLKSFIKNFAQHEIITKIITKQCISKTIQLLKEERTESALHIISIYDSFNTFPLSFNSSIEELEKASLNNFIKLIENSNIELALKLYDSLPFTPTDEIKSQIKNAINHEQDSSQSMIKNLKAFNLYTE